MADDLSEPLLESYVEEQDGAPRKQRRTTCCGWRFALVVGVAYAGVGAGLAFAGLPRWPPPAPRSCVGAFGHACGAWACVAAAALLVVLVCVRWAARRERPPTGASPEDRAGFAGRYTFWWVLPTLRAANAAGKLELGDLPALPLSDRCASLERRLRACWLARRGGSGSLLVALLGRMQPRVVLYALGHGWVFLGLMFLDPIILRRLLSDADDGGRGATRRNLGYAGALSASMFVRVACMEVCFFGSVRAMNNCRTALVPLVFREAVAVDADEGDERRAYDDGAVTNLMATDADKLGRWSWTLFFGAQWTFAVVSLPAVAWCMYGLLGTAALVGAATVVVANQCALEIGKRTKPAVLRLQEARDARAKLMQEALASVRVSKLRGWDDVVRTAVRAARAREMAALRTTRYLDALNVFVGCCASLAVPVSIFAWYAEVEGRRLTPPVAFTALAWITQMKWSINTLPDIYNLWSSLAPSCERLEAFLRRTKTPQQHREDESPPPGVAFDLDGAVGPKAAPLVRARVTARVGDLVVIVGPVGCGKSTLLKTLAGARALADGTLRAASGGARAYVGQEPFLASGTIAENVVFGLPHDAARLDDALDRCCLRPDLDALPDGARTLVGPAGVQLSGGQKARVALARALYARPDFLVLDDVLSAVDAHTGDALWRRAIAPLAGPGKATVVLATHQLAFCDRPEVTRVVDLAEDAHWRDGLPPATTTAPAPTAPPPGDADDTAPKKDRAPAGASVAEVRREVRRLLAKHHGRVVDEALERLLVDGLAGEEDDCERRREGLISLSDFGLYVRAFGSPAKVACLAGVAVLACACGVASNVWLSIWADDGAEDQTRFLVVYASIGAAQAALLACQTILLTLCALDASKTLHGRMVDAVLASPMRFFDETPRGTVLNRFLQDLASVDVDVPTVALDQLTRTLTVCSQLGLVLYFAPWVACSLPAALAPYVFIFRTVRVAARDTRRLEAGQETGATLANFKGF